MTVSTESIKTHAQKHGVGYMVGMIGGMVPAALAAISVWGYLVTEPELEATVRPIAAKIDTLLQFELERQIDKILVEKCQNPSNRALDEPLRRLLNDYRELTERDYRRQSCADLGVA